MYVNFAFGPSRAVLLIRDGRFYLDRLGTLCGRPMCRGEAGQLYRGWRGYAEVSQALARRLMALPSFRAEVRSIAAWAVWDMVRAEVGIGPAATAAYQAAAY